jgi:hypothetical protein
MSQRDKLNFATASIGWPPVWCAHERSIAAAATRKRILHFKGLIGGVPLNTQRTTVKPWVGSESWQEVFVLY